MFYIFHVGYYYTWQIQESTNYILDFQNIFSNSIYPLLLKSKAIHAFILFLLFFVFKAINVPLKDPKVLIIIRILTVILPLFGLGNR